MPVRHAYTKSDEPFKINIYLSSLRWATLIVAGNVGTPDVGAFSGYGWGRKLIPFLYFTKSQCIISALSLPVRSYYYTFPSPF